MANNNTKQSNINKKYLGVLALLLVFSFVAGISVYQHLQYDFRTLDGTKYKHRDFNNDVVLVNYFAEWCAPCLKEIPELNEFARKAPHNVRLFAISFDELGAEKMAELKTKYNIEFPLITDIKTAFPFDKPDFLPATFIIKQNGVLAGQLMGEQSAESLTEATSRLLE